MALNLTSLQPENYEWLVREAQKHNVTAEVMAAMLMDRHISARRWFEETKIPSTETEQIK